MKTKDWIILLTPIIFNGFIVVIFKNWLSGKIAEINRKQDIRNDVIKRFWNKLQDLNDTFIDVNVNTMHDPTTLVSNLALIENTIVELIKYYDSNEFDLNIFSELFNDFQNKWNNFLSLSKQYQGVSLTSYMQKNLGISLQNVKESNQNLIKEVRSKC